MNYSKFLPLVHRFQYLIILFVYFIIGFLIYANSLDNGFGHDDGVFYTDNMKNIKYLKDAFNVHHGDVYFRPITSITLRIYSYYFGNNVWAYHFTNLILFCIASWLIYRLILTLFEQNILAFLTGLFFLVHPINATFVNYVSTTGFILQVIFMTLSIICFARVIQQQQPRRDEYHASHIMQNFFQWSSNFWLWLGTLVFFIAAFMCHESSMAMPLYLLALLIFKRVDCRKIVIAIAPFFCLVLIYFLFRMKFASLHNNFFSHFTAFDMNAWQYVASLARLITWYITRFFYPAGIVTTFAVSVVREHVWQWCAVFFILVGAWLFLIKRSFNLPENRLGLSWLFIGLLPLSIACLIEPSRGLVIESYWFVFPSIGCFLFMSSFISHLYRKVNKLSVRIFASLIVICWMAVTYQYNNLWADHVLFYSYWLKSAPEYAKMNCMMATTYQKQKDYDLARTYYRSCLVNNKDAWANYYLNVGIMDLFEKKISSAKNNFLHSLELRPDSLSNYTHLGIIAMIEKDFTSAKKYFSFVIDRDRFAILPRLNMAAVYKKEGNKNEALRLYYEVLDIDPKNEIVLVSLVKLYFEQNNKDKALAIARMLLDYSRDSQTLTNVGVLFASQKLDKEAIKAFEKAINIEANFKNGYWELGQVYARNKDYLKANEIWEKGSKITPLDERFNQGLLALRKFLP